MTNNDAITPTFDSIAAATATAMLRDIHADIAEFFEFFNDECDNDIDEYITCLIDEFADANDDDIYNIFFINASRSDDEITDLIADALYSDKLRAILRDILNNAMPILEILRTNLRADLTARIAILTSRLESL